MGSGTVRIERNRHSLARPWTYELLDQRQRQIARTVRAGEPGVLLLSEVSPVITYGRRTNPGDLLLDAQALAVKGISLYPTDRGGFATYHGPGQWVLFAVDRLDRLTGDPRGVKKVITGLLEGACEVAAKYLLKECGIGEGPELGVWSAAGKCAAVGIYVDQDVVLHGLSINVYPTETSFVGVKPCGLNAPVDFIGTQAVFESVGDDLIEAVKRKLWRT